MSVVPSAGSPRRVLFVATILVGSFLLFLIQPMVARMALPRLGGAPAVWNSAMVVYQALLLAGYAYAHYLSRVPFRRQAAIHLVLLVLALATLPIALVGLPTAAPGWEVLWVPLLLALTVGPVFLLVSAQAPLMQRWYVSHAQSGEPWALYAASNIGSFAGLIAYPLLAEPELRLAEQSFAWSAGYVLLIVLVALAAWVRWHAAETVDVMPAAVSPEAETVLFQAVVPEESHETVGARRMSLWLALSAVPSGLMLSTTTHLTTDIFAMPLLWVIPLGLYLLSFTIAFADNRVGARAITLVAPALILLAGGTTMVSHSSGSMMLALASVALLFVVAVSLHSKLYDLRPHAGRLTLFYLAMSIGGALGGAFTAIAAPVLFDWVWEHPLLVFAAALLMPLPELLKWHRMKGLDPGMARLASWTVLAMAAFLAWLLYGVARQAEPGIHRYLLTIMLCGLGLLLIPWRWMFVTVLAMLMLAQGGVDTIKTSLDGRRTRSYFGIYTVLDYPSYHLRMLEHGTTLHGEQSTDPTLRREPLTYYGPNTGVAIALESAPHLFGNHARIGVVGLGTGTLACFRKPGQRWTFYEIDPAVLQLSRDRTFTYLDDCAPDAKVVIGDARLKLAEAPPDTFDVLVIDAFTSDAIPLHLLTDEAFGVYLRALSPQGVLVVHISNRFIELEPVLSALARNRGLAAASRHDNPADRTRYTPSTWLAFAREPARLEELAAARPDAPWEELAKPAPKAWTDDHASILPYIRWSHLLRKP